MQKIKIGEKFTPHPNLKKVYYVYLVFEAVLPLVLTSLPIWGVYKNNPELWQVAWPYLFIPLGLVLAAICFVVYWIQKYYHSISFTLTKEEVIVERGVWWKMKHVVPYARVMSVDTIQGPISRYFGIGSVYVYTAGYTGAVGGTAGPVSRSAEAVIWGVPNFLEIRDLIIGFVRGKPLFGAPNIGFEILEELKRIRKALEKR